MSMTTTDVLISGYGPTGETLAALLGLAGIRTLVVERDLDVYRLPRAAHFDHEIMRIFQKIGVIDAVLPWTRQVHEYQFRNAQGQILMHFTQGGVTEAVSGWAPSYMFHQPAIEDAIRARVAGLPAVEIRLGTSLKSVDSNTPEGVTATITDASGREEQVTARYLIGADGAGSIVRKLMGGSLFDYGFDEPWLVIDTIAKDEEGLPQFGVQVCDPVRPTTVMPMSPLRRRWEFMLKPGESPDDILADDRIADLLRPWVRPGQVDVIRKAVYRFHGLVAQSWRDRSVFLAGDSAHQMPPFLGQGMCSGIRDADNLAWKLIAVLKGEARPSLLDTYQQEREPHVRMIIETAIGMGRVVCVLDEQAAAMRDQAMLAARQAQGPNSGAPTPGLPGLSTGFLAATPHAGQLFPQSTSARTADGRKGRLDDLLGQGSWLLTRETGQGATLPGLENPGLTIYVIGRDVTDETGRLEGWLDSAGATSVLVRPDRYVFGTGTFSELSRSYAAAIGRA
jgi:3-(3-hydroxy-phenyl)propionate hydroxylase